MVFLIDVSLLDNLISWIFVAETENLTVTDTYSSQTLVRLLWIQSCALQLGNDGQMLCSKFGINCTDRFFPTIVPPLPLREKGCKTVLINCPVKAYLRQSTFMFQMQIYNLSTWMYFPYFVNKPHLLHWKPINIKVKYQLQYSVIISYIVILFYYDESFDPIAPNHFWLCNRICRLFHHLQSYRPLTTN